MVLLRHRDRLIRTLVISLVLLVTATGCSSSLPETPDLGANAVTEEPALAAEPSSDPQGPASQQTQRDLTEVGIDHGPADQQSGGPVNDPELAIDTAPDLTTTPETEETGFENLAPVPDELSAEPDTTDGAPPELGQQTSSQPLANYGTIHTGDTTSWVYNGPTNFIVRLEPNVNTPVVAYLAPSEGPLSTTTRTITFPTGEIWVEVNVVGEIGWVPEEFLLGHADTAQLDTTQLSEGSDEPAFGTDVPQE